MALIPSQVLRVAILLSYFSILCHYKALDMPAHQTYGGSWKFLTFIDLVIQAVFFALCVLIDVSSLLTKGADSMEQERQLRKLIGLRDWMMAVLAFPVGAFVVFTFWSLYLYDRELVYPPPAGQLHPSVAQPRHAHHSPALHHHRDADDPPPIPQQVVGSGRRLLLWHRIHPLDVLGTAGDGRLGLPGP
ncbi:hypothetical protein CesoFtcFv8_022777 [Champsocephalus esox]|uniref:Androgen-induced gene 1 protein n=1 Tax=Champsocephalus esox TaxID=159716 RepID=A0AAN8GFT3_9TELE|nr:hypothetical protein CesoFtcFv8_022777 [Champsocephalus esox]